jgi:hypothetical protein
MCIRAQFALGFGFAARIGGIRLGDLIGGGFGGFDCAAREFTDREGRGYCSWGKLISREREKKSQ